MATTALQGTDAHIADEKRKAEGNANTLCGQELRAAESRITDNEDVVRATGAQTTTIANNIRTRQQTIQALGARTRAAATDLTTVADGIHQKAVTYASMGAQLRNLGTHVEESDTVEINTDGVYLNQMGMIFEGH